MSAICLHLWYQFSCLFTLNENFFVDLQTLWKAFAKIFQWPSSLWSSNFYFFRNWRRSITKITWRNSKCGKPKWCPRKITKIRRIATIIFIPKHEWLKSFPRKSFSFSSQFSHFVFKKTENSVPSRKPVDKN